MSEAEKIQTVKNLIGDNNADVTACLLSAKYSVLNRLYPFGIGATEVPEQYELLECKIASRYYFRAGGEGEVTHSEGGVSRTYATANDEDLLMEITPFAKVL